MMLRLFFSINYEINYLLLYYKNENLIFWSKLVQINDEGNLKFALFTFARSSKTQYSRLCQSSLTSASGLKVQKEPYFTMKMILTRLKQSLFYWIRGIERLYNYIYLRKSTKSWYYFS